MPKHSKHPVPHNENREIPTPDGGTFTVVSNDTLAGAWLKLPGHDRTLSLQTMKFTNGDTATYIGYRDGIATVADKLAIAVDGDEVTIQIVLSGEGYSGVREIPLADLERIVRESGVGKS